MTGGAATRPAGVAVDELVQDAHRNKILLARGAAFTAEGVSDPHLRFNVAASTDPRIFDVLARCMDRAAARAG